MKTKMFAGAVLALALLGGCDMPAGSGGRSVERVSSATAIVESVDQSTRQVQMRDAEDGNVFTVTAGPEVRNLAQVEPGDRVDVSFYEATTVSMADPADPGNPITTVLAETAAPGERPAAAAAVSTSYVVELVSYNTDSHLAIYRLPDGRLQTAVVPQELRSFARSRQPGQRILVSLTDAVAISVSEQPAGA